MLTAVLSAFVASLCWALTGVRLRNFIGYVAGLVPLSLFIYFFSLLPVLGSQGPFTIAYPWVPSLGVELAFRVDGLSLLFALLITGIGTLVFTYTIAYMQGYKYLHRFYAYLSMFMGAMLGVVLSDNLIALFVFWELTSISSFFLIGFKNEDAASRKAALTALTITGLGGLLLLAAALVLGAAGGTFSIQGLLSSGEALRAGPLYAVAVVLVLGAAFTKSAQFPFHFWLPGAMKAPTPVSTYLHSATMVKAGVYLLLRMSPLLGGTALWHNTLMMVGGLTMAFAAFHTLFRTDLKGILAYSTISALGIMVFLTGIGTHKALLAAGLFILVHALYKACLFLVAGSVDYATGTRDVRKLSGLRMAMPLVAIAGLLACLSNAGVPPLVGFLAKDYVYEATLHAPVAAELLTGIAIFTNILLLVAGLLVGLRPFVGKPMQGIENVRPISPLIYLPPVLLGILSLLFGLAPGLIQDALVLPVARAAGADTEGMYLALWHGFNLVLLLSGVTLFAGFMVYSRWKPTLAAAKKLARLQPAAPEVLLTRLSGALYRMAYWVTRLFQSGYLRRYVRVIVLFLTILVALQLVQSMPYPVVLAKVLELTVYEVVILGIMLVAILYTVRTSSRLGAVVSMGVVGYSICMLFVYYSAPDLAMTQFTIDTLTVILFVLVLYKLPRYIRKTSRAQRIRDWMVAGALGLVIALLALAVLAEPGTKEVGAYYAENAYLKAKGKNIVNVILVDFRGIDTLVEITVLVIAALGVFGLMKLRIKDTNKSGGDTE